MIRLSKSFLSELEYKEVRRVLEIGYLGMSSEVDAFEKELKIFLNTEFHVCCVNTGTSALHLACQAIGIKENDEVLVPTLTFVASFQAVSATGGIPIPCDVDPNTGLLDLNKIVSLIGPKTKAIMYVHYAGQTGDLDQLYQIAQRYGLRIIEDAAHSFGTKYNGNFVGSFGDVICFSFDGIKNLTCGEGGAILSADHSIIEKARDARLLGVEKDSENRYAGKRSWDFDVNSQGWRYHMSDIMATIGRTQLKRFLAELALPRMQLAQRYHEFFSDIPTITPLLPQDLASIVPHIYPIRVRGGERDYLRDSLQQKDIQTGIHYKPAHLLSYYMSNKRSELPCSELLFQEILTLPLHPTLTHQDQNFIFEAIKDLISKKS